MYDTLALDAKSFGRSKYHHNEMDRLCLKSFHLAGDTENEWPPRIPPSWQISLQKIQSGNGARGHNLSPQFINWLLIIAACCRVRINKNTILFIAQCQEMQCLWAWNTMKWRKRKRLMSNGCRIYEVTNDIHIGLHLISKSTDGKGYPRGRFKSTKTSRWHCLAVFVTHLETPDRRKGRMVIPGEIASKDEIPESWRLAQLTCDRMDHIWQLKGRRTGKPRFECYVWQEVMFGGQYVDRISAGYRLE